MADDLGGETMAMMARSGYAHARIMPQEYPEHIFSG